MSVCMHREQPNIIVDQEDFKLLREKISIGTIPEVARGDASMPASELGTHHEKIFVATSGVNIADHPGWFTSGSQQLAVEWVRRESRP